MKSNKFFVKQLLILFIIPFSFFSCSQRSDENSSLILDVKKIASKTANEVEHILGEPDSSYDLQIMGRKIYCQFYNTNKIEIQYPNSLATEIIVYETKGLTFNQSTLSQFGLDYKIHPNEYLKDRLIRWNNIEPFSSISFYNVEKDSAGNIANFNIFFKVLEK
jgi:hypothetical protein